MRKWTALCLCIAMLLSVGMPAAAADAAELQLVQTDAKMSFQADNVYYAFTPDSFKESLGGWHFTADTLGGYRSQILFGGAGEKAESATAALRVGQEKMYYIWTHSRDFTDRPGMRFYQIDIDSNVIGQGGKHGGDGWAWDKVGSVGLTKGDHELKLVDASGQWARCDMILVTDDPEFTPGNTKEDLEKLEKEYLYDKDKVVVAPDEEDPDRPDDEIAVKFNGEYLKFDVPPMMMNDRTLVPMRAIFEALGCTVTWDDETQTATGTRNGKIVSVTIGSTRAKINGKNTTIDQSAVLKDDRTLVPLRFISEAYDAQVDWKEDTQTVNIMATIPKAAFYITAESLQDIGTWVLETATEGRTGVRGLIPQNPADGQAATPDDADISEAKPASAQVNVAKAGKYKLWVHAKDFATNQPGTRYFNVSINGEMSPTTFGQHGKEGFAWADGGEFDLKEGLNNIEILDTSGFYARFDALFLTEDLTMTPPESHEAMLAIAIPVDLLAEISSPVFPSWALESKEAVEETSIESEFTKVVFAKANDETHGDFVQNEIYVKDNGQWVKVKDRTAEHGYLFMKALSSVWGGTSDGTQLFKQTVDYDGRVIESMTGNPYKTGVPTWMIPSGFEKVSDSKVILTFNEDDKVDLQVIWEFDQRAKDPKVTIDADFKADGAYSFIVSNGNGFADDQYESALMPFRIMEKRVPEEQVVFQEHYLFTPMGTVTLPETNSIVPGKKLTTGVTVDADWIPRGYVYRENSRFGVAMRDVGGDVRGNIMAPLIGNFKSGENYTFSYRVVNQLDTWFETYKHIAQDLFDVHDYRSNYFTNLNDAIYNTTDLMMNDVWGGWDPIDKAHYNMEEKDLTSVANPMIAIQRYLLTEDESILENRAIPTLANLLTRMNIHFKRYDSVGGASYIGSAKPTPIGSPIAGYNLNVYGGLYEMSRGAIPSLLGIGLEKAGSVTNSYGNIPAFANDLELYRYTKDEKYLTSAKQKADEYLKDTVYSESFNSTMPAFSSFINISYYPNLASLMDIYEVTKEQKYLDAAIKTGQMLATTVWVPGIDNDKGTTDYTIVPEETLERPFMKSHNFWWHGSEQWRLGNNDGEAKPPTESNTPLTEETVPGWLPSRVGLGLEQASTFSEALNIYMNTWAGQMVKLSEYSGDPYFETVARNAVIGRFGNYAGYYQNRYIVHQMRPEYPYQGPDLTSVYWHHIPPFLAMLEDFLINEFWAKSDQQITFPSVRQQGYAYFNSNQYGFEAGQFYDQTDMWLWNDRGIVQPESVQIDYLPARKDGVLAISFLNESDQDVTTPIQLGEKVPGGAAFTGKAAVYAQDGTKSETDVVGGKFTLTVPAKDIVSVVLQIPGVKAPAYAKVDYQVDDAYLGETVTTHDRGKGYVLQLTPDNYFAYVYVTNMAKDTKELKMTYKVGDKTETVSTTEYPYEFIIKVDDPSKDFSYDLEVISQAGASEKIKGGTLRPVSRAQNKTNSVKDLSKPEEVEPNTELGDFTPFPITYVGQGTGPSTIRLVVPLSDFPFEVKENALKGLPIRGTFTDKATGEKIEFDSVLNGNEIRPNQVVLLIKPTDKVPAKDYDNDKAKTHTIELTIYPAGK